MVWTLLLIFLIAGTVSSWSVIVAALNCKWSNKFYPDTQAHHTHSGKALRIGGIGIIIGFILTFGLLFLINYIYGIFDINDLQKKNLIAVIVGAVACFTLGFIDDIRPIDAKFKFFIQIFIAIFAYQSGLSIDRVVVPFLEWELDFNNYGMFLTIIWFVSIINLINLIDGLDGLAGGIGLMLMILLAVLSAEKVVDISTFISIGMAGAILGFLIHNFPPAKVYMGDSGAYAIGFIIAALALMNLQKGAVIAALLGPMMAMALPIIDVLFALIRRALQGLPLFRPDKDHIHHKLMKSGLSRKKTVLVLYAISMVAFVGGILAFSNQGRFFPIFIGFASVIIIFSIRIYGNPSIHIRELFADSFNSRYETQNAIRLSKWFVSEIDRIRRGEDLFKDYKILLRKLGFEKVTIIIDGVERTYKYSEKDSEEIFEEDELFIKSIMKINSNEDNEKIIFWGRREFFPNRRFPLNTDIAFEAWVSATKRWKVLNEEDFNFGSIAKKQDNLKIENARDLYLS